MTSAKLFSNEMAADDSEQLLKRVLFRRPHQGIRVIWVVETELLASRKTVFPGAPVGPIRRVRAYNAVGADLETDPLRRIALLGELFPGFEPEVLPDYTSTGTSKSYR
jgi:hypothetical protein